MALELIVPDWQAPPAVGAAMSTRRGGVSAAPFDSLNLRPPFLRADALDDPRAVAENQRRYAEALGAQPVWLDQVHGSAVVRLHAGLLGQAPPVADASVCSEPGLACTVLVADCLPVLLAAGNGRAVAAAHAGWRGLAGGVVENALAALCEAAACEPAEVQAWLGACIGPRQFEVGADVLEAFGGGPEFTPRPRTDGSPRWLADLPGLARARLQRAGVRAIAGGNACTVEDTSRFFSFRRDRVTGRLAASVWLRR